MKDSLLWEVLSLSKEGFRLWQRSINCRHFDFCPTICPRSWWSLRRRAKRGEGSIAEESVVTPLTSHRFSVAESYLERTQLFSQTASHTTSPRFTVPDCACPSLGSSVLSNHRGGLHPTPNDRVPMVVPHGDTGPMT
jgi:hypothetical protein